MILRLLTALLLLPSLCFSFECPVAGETAADCPWAGAARLIEAGENVSEVFSTYTPGLLKQLDADKAHPAIPRFWGESVNYDELAKGEIVRPGILSFIAERAHVSPPEGRIMHAGLEHTYGYLLSLLPTKFGFKRARWVRPDIEDGLGLPRGSLGPSPSSGTLLSNITCLAGGIAFREDAAVYERLEKSSAACSAAIRQYAFSPIKRTRLTEEVRLDGGRAVSLRTDLVPFNSEAGGNTHLLVYSVHDSARGGAFLVTAFPVNAASVERSLARSGLGKKKPVQTRCNAYVRGLTESGMV